MSINSNDCELDVLDIKETFSTPNIYLDAKNASFVISGNSYPEDPLPVYMPVIEWFQRYLQNPLDKTVLELKFTYFSTASTQLIFELFRMLESIYPDHDVLIKWYYSSENEEIHENGEDFSTLFDIPFELIELD